MLVLWSLVSCNYYINQYQIKGLDENLYSNMLAIVAAELISILLTRFIYSKSKAVKKILVVSQIICFIGAVGLVVMKQMEQSNPQLGKGKFL